MKGKLSTKTIIIAIITVVLLAVAVTGTVVFLKDSGEAAAMEEQNILPVAGSNNESETSTEQTGENGDVNPENPANVNQAGNAEQETQTENQSQGNQNQTGATTTPAQTTGTITEEPAVSTMQRERTISEETTLGWNNLSVASLEADYSEKNINYNNLKYTVNYYEDGELVHTDIIKGNKLGKEINEVENRMKDEYYLDEENSTKLPFIVTEKENENVINIHYLIKKYNVKFVAGENGELEGTTEFIVPSGSEFGSNVTVPTPKAKDGYCFDKWDPTLPTSDSKVTVNATYTATFKKKTDLSYTVNYYYNDNEKPGKTITKENQTFGTIIKKEDLELDSYKTYNGKEYTLKEITTAQEPYISNVLIVSNDPELNVINVYFVRPEIQSEKTSIAYDSNGNRIEGTTIHPGDTIEYTIKVWNTGCKEIDVTINDQIPAGTEFVSGENSKTVNVPGKTSKDKAKTITFKVKVKEDVTGKIKNTATLTNGPDATDPKEYNVVKPAKIVVSKTADQSGTVLKSGTVLTGTKVKYTLTATNQGEEKGTVKIKDAKLQTLINDNKVKLEGNIETSDGNTITVASLAKGIAIEVNGGATKTITYTVEVTANAKETIRNKVEVVEGGTVNKEKEEVVLNVERKATVTKLTEKKNTKNIIIAIDRSESMRYNEKYKNAKKAVKNILDVIYPDSNTNQQVTTKVIAYAGIATCKTIGETAGYSGVTKLKDDVDDSVVLGITDLEYVLKYIAKEIPTTDPTKNVVIFVGDGGTGWLAGKDWNDCEENSDKLKAKATVYTIGTQSSDVLKNMATDATRTYSTINGYTEDGLTEALKKVITDISIKTETSTKDSLDGKILLEDLRVDEKHPIEITVGTSSEKITSLSNDKITTSGGKYYLDLTKINVAGAISITYYTNN